MRASELLKGLMSETAQRLQALAAERILRRVNERDHLAKCFRETLIEELPGTRYRPARSGERRCNLPEHFPRVGDVDALLVPDTGAPVWVELKCDSDRRWALAACGWDAVKSAVGLGRGAASEGYLLAGAPATLWRARILGAELFAGGTWRAEDVRAAFEAPFRSYEELADPRPVLVPDRFETEAVGTPAAFTVDATAWELRLAQVTVADGGWYAWPPFLPPDQQARAIERRSRRR